MAKHIWGLLLGALFVVAVVFAAEEQKKTYIVHMEQAESVSGARLRSLQQASLDAIDADPASVLYTYSSAMNGYAAQLTEAQAEALRAYGGVLSVRPERMFQLHTTRTPQFLGLASNEDLYGQSSLSHSAYLEEINETDFKEAESNIIIGLLDTGAWPENPGYSDEGMGPIPEKWRGQCEEGEQWTVKNCNKKLIGARFYYKGYTAARSNATNLFNWTGEYKSPRDNIGHGTHTSTTTAGSEVRNAGYNSLAKGTARGIAKYARIAMYKVCWKEDCAESDIAAAIDQAIMDGVNVLSLSQGPNETAFHNHDAIVVGSYAAMEKGIFVSLSAGNDGPEPGTVKNIPPWAMTVAASTLDRDFPAELKLGSNKIVTGASLYRDSAAGEKHQSAADSGMLRLVLGADVSKGNASTASFCLKDSLDPKKVAGKAVICRLGRGSLRAKGQVVKEAGGRGIVIVSPALLGDEAYASYYVLPGIHLSYKQSIEVEAYAKTPNATVTFQFRDGRVGIPAPIIAGFSGRGPNMAAPNLLKPDITGPGVDILAGWTNDNSSTNKGDFAIISGTSMSAPHLAGIAASIMARRPKWSAAEVRSAIMTTAYTTLKGTSSPMLEKPNDTITNPLSYGNGHVDPIAALDPGLVYDISPYEYRDSLCAFNTTVEFTRGITRSNFTCAPGVKRSVYDLNYPSFAAFYNVSTTNGTHTAMFSRTVKNVGGAGTYNVRVLVDKPDMVTVSVKPAALVFTSEGEKQTYVVAAKMQPSRIANATAFGRLEWSDGKHVVGSSMAFVWGFSR
ncbi:Subtilisin-like protease [Colletotrichum fructicola]|uniref:Subtilisin-like protease n=1 Tax=Colletotrichum fructicola (strain Nara gc5) TaxID=1213859 RepID=L2GGW8_COLFN|nr:Subtilisin-like protease [Colletotrichum fructicola]KAE9583266.1 Subtilisin-like protease [Colletotrichum fructicola]KAF4481073.1 Subtilisin-like protease SBT1.7 [Colletotrichum fructicola Nara gc5]KAF4887617.1 Subtilisin-like protease SBT1.7 [Colletotrichum fructicola]